MTPTRMQVELGSWGLCAAGLIGCVVGWALSPAAFAAAWCAALMLLLAWPVGSIALASVHVLTGGRWGTVARPALVLGMVASPVLLLAIVPLLVLASPLYGWAHPDIARTLHNTRYLNLPFYWGRVGGMVVLWVLLAALALLFRVRFLAAVILALLLVSVTIAAVDLCLSLDPHYNSTAFGMVIAAEWALFALSIATLGAALAAVSDSDGLESLGKLLLLTLILWGYLVFVQFLIVWSSDLGSDAPWYVARSENGWGIVGYFLFVFHFAVPFALLLRRRAQRSRPVLIAVAAMLITTEVLRAWWLVLPSVGRTVGWIDGLAMVAVLGLGAGLFLRLPLLLSRLKAEGIAHA